MHALCLQVRFLCAGLIGLTANASADASVQSQNPRAAPDPFSAYPPTPRLGCIRVTHALLAGQWFMPRCNVQALRLLQVYTTIRSLQGAALACALPRSLRPAAMLVFQAGLVRMVSCDSE